MMRRKPSKAQEIPVDLPVNAILTSDWHLREDAPICRTDDFEEAQWKKVDFISALQRRFDCAVLHGGDLFHYWKPSPSLLTKTLKHLPDRFYTVLGQHDLQNHSLELYEKSGVATLEESGRLTVLPGCHWGQEPPGEGSLIFPCSEIRKSPEDRRVLVWHHLAYLIPPFPGAQNGQAVGLLRKYPQFDLILTGDNHQTVVLKDGSRLLINPGSLTRQDADQGDHAPCVFLYHAAENRVTKVNIPITPGVVSRKHLELKERKDARIAAFVDRLVKNWQSEVSFEANLKEFQAVNTVAPVIIELIMKAIDEETAEK